MCHAPLCLSLCSPRSVLQVWSFGVTLIECFSDESIPYENLPDNTVCMNYVLSGGFPDCPARCPTKFYQIAKACFHMDRAQRPTFTKLVTLVKSAIDSHAEETAWQRVQGRLSGISHASATKPSLLQRAVASALKGPIRRSAAGETAPMDGDEVTISSKTGAEELYDPIPSFRPQKQPSQLSGYVPLNADGNYAPLSAAETDGPAVYLPIDNGASRLPSVGSAYVPLSDAGGGGPEMYLPVASASAKASYVALDNPGTGYVALNNPGTVRRRCATTNAMLYSPVDGAVASTGSTGGEQAALGRTAMVGPAGSTLYAQVSQAPADGGSGACDARTPSNQAGNGLYHSAAAARGPDPYLLALSRQGAATHAAAIAAPDLYLPVVQPGDYPAEMSLARRQAGTVVHGPDTEPVEPDDVDAAKDLTEDLGEAPDRIPSGARMLMLSHTSADLKFTSVV